MIVSKKAGKLPGLLIFNWFTSGQIVRLGLGIPLIKTFDLGVAEEIRSG